jgi:hypothetical protein
MATRRRRRERGLRVTTPEAASKFKGMIFGPHGAGKTRMLGTAQDDERTSPMLFLAFEPGTHTLVGKQIDVITCRSFEDFNEPFEVLSSPDHGGYRSVGIDSLSEVQIEGMLELVKGSAMEDVMEQSQWGQILIKMRRFVRNFKDLDMHVFLTALAKEETRARIGTVQVPLLQGSFAQELPGIVDVVGYLAQEDMEDGEVTRTLLLRNFPKFSVKARAPWGVEPPDEVPDPDVSSLLDALGYE